MTNFAFPFHVDRRGRTAGASGDDHLRHLVEQLLFTSPGERINRPSFGTALRQMVFSPLSEEIAAAMQLTIQGALQQWLGDLLQVGEVQVRAEDATVHVTVEYAVRASGQRQTLRIERAI